jgi:hypothetical protein
LTFFINALNLKPVCIIGQNGADFHSGTTNIPIAFSLVNLFTVSMTRHGGGTNQLLSDDQLNMDIHETCVENDISISSQWIPRESNKEADSLSRMNNCDD